jgi:hypothetical protein
MNIDYSNNDIFDANNKLFRLSKKNIGETNEAIKKTDADKDEKIDKLKVSGSEIINNLNQINYTFLQIKAYMDTQFEEMYKEMVDNGDDGEDESVDIDESLFDDDDFEDPLNFSDEEETKEEKKAEEKKEEDPDDKFDFPIDRTKTYTLLQLQEYNKAIIRALKKLGDRLKKTKDEEEKTDIEQGIDMAISDVNWTVSEIKTRRGYDADIPAHLRPEPPMTGMGKKGEPVFPTVDDDDDLSSNLKQAKKLDSLLKETERASSKNYITKINDLMSNLTQFVGQTNFLYISKVKKNLNFLEEDQIKAIYNEVIKLKPNLESLKTSIDFGAIHIDTIYKNLSIETNNLYKSINDTIRNYSKLKDYRNFSGAGLMGGYFIESDSPFIRQSTTKRYL